MQNQLIIRRKEMKQALKIVAIIVVIAAAIIGCNRVDLAAPTLISPADGAPLYSGLTFIWSSGQEAEEYVIHVWTGSTDVIQETLTDTTYVMSDSAFSALTYGAYNWAVASVAGSRQEWSETRSFSLSQPGAPVLIAPEDGAIFDAEPPTFVWHADSLNPDYVIRVVFTTDTSTVLEDTLTDTTYAMSTEVFDGLTNGTYSWWVGSVVTNGLILSSTRTFDIDKPILLDLDTTYFPFGLSYEWKFEQHEHGYDDSDAWNNYDTFRVWVVDSFWVSDTLFIQLQSEGTRSYPGQIYELSNPVKIINDSIPISMPGYFFTAHDTIPLSTKHDTTLTATYGLTSAYSENLLSINLEYERGVSDECCYNRLSRQKGIGTLSQRFGCDSPWASSTTYDRLLYFYNGQDTVYKVD